jgi:hypothetical protein
MDISSPQVSATNEIYRQAVIDDLAFLEAWEKGMIPCWSSTALRVRQLRRANPTLHNENRQTDRDIVVGSAAAI